MGIKEWKIQKSQSFTLGRSNVNSSSSGIIIKHQECIELGKTTPSSHHDNNRNGERSRWKMLWTKIKMEKQRILSSNNNLLTNNTNNTKNNNPSSVTTSVAYDPEAYASNFDEGLEGKEPEYLIRSFSARFADPSRILHKNGSISF